jgi:hypothetical protein
VTGADRLAVLGCPSVDLKDTQGLHWMRHAAVRYNVTDELVSVGATRLVTQILSVSLQMSTVALQCAVSKVLIACPCLFLQGVHGEGSAPMKPHAQMVEHNGESQ